MDREEQLVGELTRIAHSAADALVRLMQGGGPPIVLIEPALNSVAGPVQAAVVEREWMRTSWTPGMPDSRLPETFRATEIRVADMIAHFGPFWIEIVGRLVSLVGSDYFRWLDSLDPVADLERFRGQVHAHVSDIEQVAKAAGLSAEWENSAMLPQIITQYNGGLYLSAHRGDADPSLSSLRNGQAFLLMIDTVAGVFEAESNTKN